MGCVFCDALVESTVHLFQACPVILLAWYQMSSWLGWEFVIPLGLAQQFLSFTGLGGGEESWVRFASRLTCCYLDHLNFPK